MLTATPQGLLRGKANGQGQRLIFAQPNLHREKVFSSQGDVVYSRGHVVQQEDIWTVRTDGTGDHALLNTPARERLNAVSSPWIMYTLTDPQVESRSLRLDTQAQFVMNNTGYPAEFAFFQNGQRVMVMEEYALFSKTTNGTDEVVHARVDDYGQQYTRFGGTWIVEDTLVYRIVLDDGHGFLSDLYAVPLAGGAAVQLDDAQTDVGIAISSGRRIVYPHCSGFGVAGCDVSSVNLDGTGRVTLANHPANEALQGVTTSQAIIRRNLAGSDQLIAVPVSGGPEKLLMTMTDNEFVDLIVGDLLIVRRPSGTWSLDLNGKFTKLGTIVGDSGFVAVGDAVCVTKVTAVWCMPLDGSGPQFKIADQGKVVGVL